MSIKKKLITLIITISMLAINSVPATIYAAENLQTASDASESTSSRLAQVDSNSPDAVGKTAGDNTAMNQNNFAAEGESAGSGSGTGEAGETGSGDSSLTEPGSGDNTGNPSQGTDGLMEGDNSAETGADGNDANAGDGIDAGTDGQGDNDAQAENVDSKKVKYRASDWPQSKTLKILIIGNSFGNDTASHMYSVCEAAGYKVRIGVLVRIRETLANHAAFFESGTSGYQYKKNTSGKWKTVSSECSAQRAIKDEAWDFIYFNPQSQQTAFDNTFYHTVSGKKSYYIDELITYAKNWSTNKSVKFGFIETWAWPVTSANKADATLKEQFPSSNGNFSQTVMYNKVAAGTKKNVAEQACGTKVDYICPVGTAVQNARSGYVKDTLNRDDRHLGYRVGRNIAAMCLAYTSGVDISKVKKERIEAVTPCLALIRKSVKDAVQNPYKVTSEKSLKKPSVSSYRFKLSRTSYKYNGKARKPSVKSYVLVDGKDYSVKYRNNKKAGTAKVIITGRYYMTGTKTLTFKIKK